MAFEDLGEQLVKNIAHPIRAFRLRIGEDLSGQEATIPEIRFAFRCAGFRIVR
jgi:hypothetical protein